MFPNFPALKDFLAFREKITRRTPFAVTVAHSKLIRANIPYFASQTTAQFLSLALQLAGIEEGFVCIRVQF